MEIGTEISEKIKTAIKSKLVEFGSYVDEELPDYIMVMVANKRSELQMIDDLHLFLGDNSQMFCAWLHDLLQKLQEVTEGAFEVKVPIKIKLDEVNNESKTNANDNDNETLKISKISRKPSPIRLSNTDQNNHEESFDSQTEGDANRSTDNKNGETFEKHHRKEENLSGGLQSAVIVQKRPTLPPSKQANPILLKKAMEAAQASAEDGEYNPETPASSDLPDMSGQNPESKRRQRELLLEEHKKLQRLKSQQEDSEETGEPMIELQVAEDDDLFATEEPVVKDRRIVVEKNPESDPVLETSKKEKSKSQAKKEKKLEKRRLEEDEASESRSQTQSASGSEDDTKAKDKPRSVKSKDKRRKPKFIVTLEGVGSDFEEKYEKEHSRKKRRRKSNHREDERPTMPNIDVPLVPVYPPLIQGVHQVPGMAPIHLNPIPPPPPPGVHVVPPTIMPPLPVDRTAHTETGNMEYEDDEMNEDKEICRFWPQCKNGTECPYYHPDVNCKHFPNCRYGKDCSYLHPQCKFGSRCTSTSCYYSHSPTTTASSTDNQTVCRYHPFCTRKDCPFLHPVEKPCRYGTNCTRPNCPFSHSTPPPREQLKWVAPKTHVSDRQFAVKEASTTPLQVQ